MSTVQRERVLGSLARRASQRFAWRWETVEIADQKCQLAVASDPDSMLIDACQRQDAGEQGVIDPFWATTWRAAAGLDRYLNRLDLDGIRVLELGCGTGHAGLAAAHRGGRVVLTDGVSDPLLLVRMSTWRLRDRCQVRRLRFGIDRLDEPRFPLILGSDVTYLRSLWPVLDQCVKDHLEDGGQLLLSDPYRIIANEFRGWIKQHGWQYSEHKIQLDDDPEHPIRVMQLQRTPYTDSPRGEHRTRRVAPDSPCHRVALQIGTTHQRVTLSSTAFPLPPQSSQTESHVGRREFPSSDSRGEASKGR